MDRVPAWKSKPSCLSMDVNPLCTINSIINCGLFSWTIGVPVGVEERVGFPFGRIRFLSHVHPSHSQKR